MASVPSEARDSGHLAIHMANQAEIKDEVVLMRCSVFDLYLSSLLHIFFILVFKYVFRVSLECLCGLVKDVFFPAA